MKFALCASLVAASSLSACAPAANVAPTKVTVESGGYKIGAATYASADALAEALKAIPKLESIYLAPEPGIASERVSQTIASIRAAGISVPILMVGNEVFKK